MTTVNESQTPSLDNQKIKSVTPRHPYLVLAIAIIFPGVGQVMNSQPARGLVMIFFMFILGVITYQTSSPDISTVGRFSGGIFIYAVAVMDAYKWARVRWSTHHYNIKP